MVTRTIHRGHSDFLYIGTPLKYELPFSFALQAMSVFYYLFDKAQSILHL